MNSKLTMILRIFLGLILVVFGANKFFGFMPSMELPEGAMALMGAMVKSGYLLKLVGITEIVAGLLLLVNKWTPFALIILAPVSLNMALFHLFLAPASIGPAAVVTLINAVLIYDNWSKFKILF